MLQIYMPDGYEYKVTFQHDAPAYTRCTISDVIQTPHYPIIQEVISGFALCSSRDVFNYETGRKISMSRAMSKMGWPKEWRRMVWFKYFENRTENPDLQLILTHVPEAALMSYSDALKLAKERDAEQARQLQESF